MTRLLSAVFVTALAAATAAPAIHAQPVLTASDGMKAAPRRAEGEGPWPKLILRGANLIDGTGGPVRGPIDIVIENNRIVRVADVGFPNSPIDPTKRPKGPAKEIDVTGMYVLPGLVDLHLHTGESPKNPEAEYVYKLWMGHGVTTGRGVGFSTDTKFALSEKARSARNEITAPRMWEYEVPGGVWDFFSAFQTADEARTWVREAKQRGVDGFKLTSFRPEIFQAITSEAAKLGLGTVAHLAQTGVNQVNAADAARMGLGTITHFYGLFEAMYESADVQPYPENYNYNDEQWRFGQVARQWTLVKPKSEKWWALLKTLKEHDVTLDPTMTAYLSGRDVMARRNADWHETYTLPSLWDFYTPNRVNHGAYFYNWTTWDEVAWRNFYRVWHELLVDYKNLGGRVTASSDAGFIYNTYGFSTIQEMELLQEAGFHPLEVIRAATLHAAETITKPLGRSPDFGVIRPGMLADLVVVPENPVANLKVLYGSGVVRLNDHTGKVERAGGVKYTIKDGIVYDAKKLLADVAAMVAKQKRDRGIARLPTPQFDR
ncbi:MAG: amidohydrolase family protein [Gemmatimonadetes bacterium]|nr:amidohydrolase family protein [Gemmatimonadota bacterium]